ncbi:hypothetical protein B0T22DRAFT_10238 [Podospora appendiculata]|uniref:Uncharacterized protein n=1 Tax=Podospora appendiculata TaxID=314037 RepID=A0AAE0XFF2_9PEZI|nr:hypothetical protein B0T22DRAFT_10238 [Podospora appendiculata]
MTMDLFIGFGNVKIPLVAACFALLALPAGANTSHHIISYRTSPPLPSLFPPRVSVDSRYTLSAHRFLVSSGISCDSLSLVIGARTDVPVLPFLFLFYFSLITRPGCGLGLVRSWSWTGCLTATSALRAERLDPASSYYVHPPSIHCCCYLFGPFVSHISPASIVGLLLTALLDVAVSFFVL